MNPIKTPQQMLLEAAGIPHMAEGSAAPNPKKLGLELMKRAIKDYVRINNRQPNTAELEALTKQVQMMSAPTGYQPIGTPQAAARARHELATDPNLLDPNRPDPFVTQMTLGRASNRTWLKPKTLDVNDPNVAKSIEAKQVEGLADEGIYGVGQSSTPASDAISKIATGLESQALMAGKSPIIDKLKLVFFKKHGRYPDDLEVEQMIAEFNPLRHQYGEKGMAHLASRPPTAKGMKDWVQQGRAEGIPESVLTNPPTEYPAYAKQELDISRGVQPAVRPQADDLIKNPNREYAGGSSVAAMSPREMQAMMIAYGREPQKFSDGRQPERGYQQSWKSMKDFFSGVVDSPYQSAKEIYDIGRALDLIEKPQPLYRTEMRAPEDRFIRDPENASAAYRAGTTLGTTFTDPLNLVFAGPAGKLAGKAARTMIRNPIKTSVIGAGVPSVSIGSDIEPRSTYRSVMEGYK